MVNESGVMIIAEVGGNHEGDYEYARRLLQDAAAAGVDVVKFQIYTGDSLVNRRVDPDRAAHFDRFTLPTSKYIALAEECRALGVEFNASIWDIAQIEVFDHYLSFYKIGSGDLTAYPLLKAIAATRKPIVLSTGLATLEEVREAVAYLCRVEPAYLRPDMLGILQCTSMYPIPDEEANLNVITTLRKAFDYRIGYSDHTEGTYAAEIAVALGAEILELHFTDQREGRDFRDHRVSFTGADIRQLRERIATVKRLMGSFDKAPTKSEIDNGHLASFRRALYPSRDIAAGEGINESDLIALRPVRGMAANEIDLVVGKCAARALEKYQVLGPSDLIDCMSGSRRNGEAAEGIAYES